MNDHSPETDADGSLTRRSLLSLGAGATVALTGFGTFAGSAAPWGRFDADFRGCSEVWLVVDEGDLEYNPPATAHVIVTDNGSASCELVEFTAENATTIPGQYGDAPLVKYTADDEKVLGVIEYNIPFAGDDRFSRPRCPVINTNQCATTPNVPDFREAPCFQSAKEIWDDTNRGCTIPEPDDGSGPGRSDRNNANQGRDTDNPKSGKGNRSKGNGRGNRGRSSSNRGGGNGKGNRGRRN